MMTEPSLPRRASVLRKTVLALLQDSPAASIDRRAQPDDREVLFAAHLAEYEAITNRNTHWLTLQYALLPILGAGFAVLAQLWDQFDKDPALSTQAHRIMIWIAILFTNVIIIAHTQVGWESYNNVVYLENYLRKEIILLLPRTLERKNEVLGYEKYLRDQRGRGPKWWEVPGPFTSLGLLLGGTGLFGIYYPWTLVEWIAVPVNTILFLVIVKVTVKMVKRRKDIGTRSATT